MRDLVARHLRACLCLLMCPALATAQIDSPANRVAMTLAEALTRTVARNPELIAAGFHIAAAEGRLQQARLAPNPELDVVVEDALGTDGFRSVESAQTTVTLGWILERGVRQRLIDTARAGMALSRFDAEIGRLDVAADTARRFVVCLAYQSRLLNAAEAVRLAEDSVQAVTSRVAASRTPAAELARAQARLARAELLEQEYGHELLSAYHRLSAQWGETQPDFSSVSGDLSKLPRLEPFETLLARVEQNTELARFMSQQRIGEAELRLAQARSKPNWHVYTGLRRFEGTDDLAVVGGITVPLPVRNRNQGRIAEARANIARSEASENAARVRIETSLFVLYQELQRNTQLAARLTDDIIPRIERALTDTRRAYELGRYSYFEWSVVQAELLEANNDLLEASIDAHRIIIEIERLTGTRIAPPAATQ